MIPYRLVLLLVFFPVPARAHDAFGDLGPFYAGFLHPLADPIQATLILATAAFLARRPLAAARLGLPLFIAMAVLAHGLAAWRSGLVAPPLFAAGLAVLCGGAAMLPPRWVPDRAGLVLVAATGLLVGLGADLPESGPVFQPHLGTGLGISVFVLLAWTTLDAASRQLSPIAPAIAGSWAAAIGILVVAFSFQAA